MIIINNKNIRMKAPYIPNELLDIILEYDGRIKYKNGQYVTIIHQNDERYSIIRPIINKKIEITKKQKLSEHNGSGFLFAINFNMSDSVGLLYDYNFSCKNKFEICYYNWKNDNVTQMRVYI